MTLSGFAKRTLDMVVATIALVLLFPILVIAGVAVYVSMGQPIFFRQLRPGLHGVPFCMLKFRTMTSEQGADGQLLPDAQRLTRVGHFLRSSTIDELPELINVLRGDMSLVGPRPLLICYLDRYTRKQARRHEVKPGLTGWAVVKGRNAISWDEKFNLDVWYVDHQSFWLDVKILFMTVWLILSRKGVSQAGHATMPEFMGTQESSAPK